MSEQLHNILDHLEASGGIALAFSGGMDSTALLEICLRRGLDVLALHLAGPHQSSAHTRETIARLEARNIPHKIIACSALSLPELRRNHPRRCYFCKLHTFTLLRQAAEGRTLCDGSNAQDLTSYRPGLAALAELGICSPLAEAGLDKKQLRALAARLGFNLPASGGQNCLLTRFAYNLEINENDLRDIEAAEERVRPLLHPLNFRLRKLSANKRELHVESATPLPAALLADLATTLPGTPVVAMENLSGFFDKDKN